MLLNDSNVKLVNSTKWWKQIELLESFLHSFLQDRFDPMPTSSRKLVLGTRGSVAKTAVFDTSKGAILVEDGAIIGDFVKLVGPCYIGRDTIIGDYAKVTGSYVADNVLVGSYTEVKNSSIGMKTRIGPGCYVGDSVIEEEVFFGAQVRTSNYNLNGQEVSVQVGTSTWETKPIFESSGRTKLGCFVGKGASLGIQCIVYPGRVIAAGSTYEPRCNIVRNNPAGRYRVAQDLQSY